MNISYHSETSRKEEIGAGDRIQNENLRFYAHAGSSEQAITCRAQTPTSENYYVPGKTQISSHFSSEYEQPNRDSSLNHHGENGIAARVWRFEPTSSSAPRIGQDVWRQLECVKIPTFSGDKRTSELQTSISGLYRERSTAGETRLL